jgi:hypothetical protein
MRSARTGAVGTVIGAFVRRTLWAAFLLICSGIAASDAAAENSLLAAYVVMGPQGAVARAVFEGTVTASCPKIDFGVDQPSMDVRAQPSPGFPVTVCEKAMPAGTKSAAILGRPLPVPKNSLASIVVLGDTGCRPARENQCNPNDWPFEKLSDNAAASHPDLVIHVGDYLYRGEDTWENWKADFFDPARNLLAAAPWIAARGNHEICSRGGGGYLRLLADQKEPTQCKDNCYDISPYTVMIGDRQFIVFDSSDLPHEIPDVKRYTEQFDKVAKLVKPHSWFITHVPTWGVIQGPHGPAFIDPTLQQALEKGDPDHSLLTNSEIFLSGHIHLWEAIGFAKGPPQFVLGNGGADLALAINSEIRGRTIDGRTVNSWNSQRLWGSTQFTPTSPDGGWKATATFLDKPVNKSVVCDITSQGRVSCGSLQVAHTMSSK